MSSTHRRDSISLLPTSRTCWVHEYSTWSLDIVVNPTAFPCQAGDIVELSPANKDENVSERDSTILFKVAHLDAERIKKLGNLQVHVPSPCCVSSSTSQQLTKQTYIKISVSNAISQAFGISNRDEVLLTKVRAFPRSATARESDNNCRPSAASADIQ
jgi:hypothetical protein